MLQGTGTYAMGKFEAGQMLTAIRQDGRHWMIHQDATVFWDGDSYNILWLSKDTIISSARKKEGILPDIMSIMWDED